MVSVLVAVKGTEDESFFGRVVSLLPVDRVERLLVAHVVDPGPRDDLAFGRERYVGRRRMGEDRRAAMEQAEDQGSRAGLTWAREALIRAGAPAGVVEIVALRGKAGETLRDVAERERIDLVVVGGRGGKPGPHSIGKTARFVIDHAPRASLLVR